MGRNSSDPQNQIDPQNVEIITFWVFYWGRLLTFEGTIINNIFEMKSRLLSAEAVTAALEPTAQQRAHM